MASAGVRLYWQALTSQAVQREVFTVVGSCMQCVTRRTPEHVHMFKHIQAPYLKKAHHSISWDICEPTSGLVLPQASLTGNLERHIIGKSDHEASIHTNLGAGSELPFTRDISDGAGRGRESLDEH